MVLRVAVHVCYLYVYTMISMVLLPAEIVYSVFAYPGKVKVLSPGKYTKMSMKKIIQGSLTLAKFTILLWVENGTDMGTDVYEL
jgi:hypothetical protein